jgi:oligopeptide/dipeptide ABC transporter ATP-binding protein
MADNETLLRVSDLRTHFATEAGTVKAVDGVSFRIRTNEVFALVGESGCGKSITALSILRLIPCPPGRIASGSITLSGVDLLALPERRMQDIRGSQISMIFQEPMTSLNPVFTCGYQIVEALRLHRGVSFTKAKQLAVDMLGRVGIPEPGLRYHEYPHQLSGGMQQRVMIAIALCCGPKLLIADEPTTALDVTIQAQILDLLKGLQQQGLSILLITHDLGVVAEAADTVGVMYASGLVELADVKSLFAAPLHPYTQGLFRSLPRLGQKKHRLDTISGAVPSPLALPAGCAFHPRCTLTRTLAQRAPEKDTVDIGEAGAADRVLVRCAHNKPALLEVTVHHWCACWECEGYAGGKETDPSEEGGGENA